jgi:hypothetical protein
MARGARVVQDDTVVGRAANRAGRLLSQVVLPLTTARIRDVQESHSVFGKLCGSRAGCALYQKAINPSAVDDNLILLANRCLMLAVLVKADNYLETEGFRGPLRDAGRAARPFVFAQTRPSNSFIP